MSSEEVERAIQFLLESDARLSSKLDRLADEVGVLRQVSLDSLKLFGSLGEAMKQSDLRLRELQERTDAKFSEMAEAQKLSAEAQRRTDERLDAFIDFVERYIASRNGGKN
jgi:hypothetical protein